jgi:hypothetical protein
MSNKKIWEVVDGIYRNHSGWPTNANSPIIEFGKPSGIKIRKILSDKTYYEVILWINNDLNAQNIYFKIKNYDDDHGNTYYEMCDFKSSVDNNDILSHITRIMRDLNLKEILDK